MLDIVHLERPKIEKFCEATKETNPIHPGVVPGMYFIALLEQNHTSLEGVSLEVKFRGFSRSGEQAISDSIEDGKFTYKNKGGETLVSFRAQEIPSIESSGYRSLYNETIDSMDIRNFLDSLGDEAAVSLADTLAQTSPAIALLINPVPMAYVLSLTSPAIAELIKKESRGLTNLFLNLFGPRKEFVYSKLQADFVQRPKIGDNLEVLVAEHKRKMGMRLLDVILGQQGTDVKYARLRVYLAEVDASSLPKL